MVMIFDGAMALCVDRRQHMWQPLKDSCAQNNIEVDLFIAGRGKILESEEYDHIDGEIEGVPNSWNYHKGTSIGRNNYNVYLCHQKMFRRAKKRGYKCVLMLEDDAIILPRFSTLIDEVESLLQDMTWDACFLGYHHPLMEQWELKYQENKTVEVIAALKDVGGTHGVLIKENMFENLSKLAPRKNFDDLLCYICKCVVVIPRLIYYQNTYSCALEQPEEVRYKEYDERLLV
jgi:GR25 family glycosyltransferase involved in LPS biosynthesis